MSHNWEAEQQEQCARAYRDQLEQDRLTQEAEFRRQQADWAERQRQMNEANERSRAEQIAREQELQRQRDFYQQTTGYKPGW